MGLIDDLGRDANINLQKTGGLNLIDILDVNKFLSACTKKEVIVLGIEGFTFEGDHIRPDIEAIADFSNLSNSEQSIREARKFMEVVGRPGILFDFTIAKTQI